MAKQKSPPTAPKITRAPAWDQAHGTYLAGRSHLDGVEALAIDMANKWGVGRLRLLVPDEWREKYDRQRYLLQQAVDSGDLEAVRTHAQRMTSAWRTLDAMALDNGAQPLDPQVWEATLEDGTVLAIVKDNASAAGLTPDGRRMVVYTLDEVAKILSSYAQVNKIKIRWSGASVEVVRHSVPDPLNAIHAPLGLDTELDDPIPL